MARYRPNGQFAAGGLVGYDFGPASVQAYLTRDLAQRNYGGRETRVWLRLVVPIETDGRDRVPDRPLLTRRQAE